MNEQTVGMIGTFLPMILIFGVMYVILIMPQRRKEKKTREMINELQVGSEIVTIGGVIGKIVNIKDDEITIESGIEKTKVKLKKWAIKEVAKKIES